MSDNLANLPENMPVPTDDGAVDHLAGMELPDVEFISNVLAWLTDEDKTL